MKRSKSVSSPWKTHLCEFEIFGVAVCCVRAASPPWHLCSDKDVLAALLLQVLFSLWQDNFDDATALLFPLLSWFPRTDSPLMEEGWHGGVRRGCPRRM